METKTRDSIVKSIRLKPEEFAEIEKNAAENNMSVNRYVVKSAIEKTSTPLSPQMICYLREIASYLKLQPNNVTEEMTSNFYSEVEFVCQSIANL